LGKEEKLISMAARVVGRARYWWTNLPGGARCSQDLHVDLWPLRISSWGADEHENFLLRGLCF
jgi:hypothetical protein